MALNWNNRAPTSYQGAKHLNVWIPPALQLLEYTEHVVTPEEEGCLDLISFREYGSEQYFWVIAHANNILDPFNGFSTGNVLKVPRLSGYLERWKAYGK